MILGGRRAQAKNLWFLKSSVGQRCFCTEDVPVVPVSSQDWSLTSHLKDDTWKSRAPSNITHEPIPMFSNREQSLEDPANGQSRWTVHSTHVATLYSSGKASPAWTCAQKAAQRCRSLPPACEGRDKRGRTLTSPLPWMATLVHSPPSAVWWRSWWGTTMWSHPSSPPLGKQMRFWELLILPP